MTPEQAVNLAIDNVISEGIDDVFDKPSELDFLNEAPFRHVVAETATRALTAGGLEGLAVGPIHHVNVPKSGLYAFRRCALVEPMDHIKYLALALLAAETIESSRIPSEARRVFSYRFMPREGGLFDPRFTYASFHEHVRQRAAETEVRVVVKCDIANFYDRLNLHRLESTLLAIGTSTTTVRTINEILLHWARRDSYGLPVGSNASRILAEAALIETDRFLESIGVDFVRFVDDYQFFAPDMTHAQFWLYKTMTRLTQEGLALNSYKTRVIESRTIGSTRQSEPGDDAKFTKPVRPILIGRRTPDDRGFYTRVPRRFILPDTGETTTPPRDAGEICASLLERSVVEPLEFRELATSLVMWRDFSSLAILPRILQKHPPYIDYAMGMLSHFQSQPPAEIRNKLSIALGEFLYSPLIEIPEWHKLQIVKLLGTPDYANREAILRLLRSMSRQAGAAIGRAAFDALYSFASRGDALEIKEFFRQFCSGGTPIHPEDSQQSSS
jgi:hypothetical protein